MEARPDVRRITTTAQTIAMAVVMALPVMRLTVAAIAHTIVALAHVQAVLGTLAAQAVTIRIAVRERMLQELVAERMVLLAQALRAAAALTIKQAAIMNQAVPGQPA